MEGMSGLPDEERSKRPNLYWVMYVRGLVPTGTECTLFETCTLVPSLQTAVREARARRAKTRRILENSRTDFLHQIGSSSTGRTKLSPVCAISSSTMTALRHGVSANSAVLGAARKVCHMTTADVWNLSSEQLWLLEFLGIFASVRCRQLLWSHLTQYAESSLSRLNGVIGSSCWTHGSHFRIPEHTTVRRHSDLMDRVRARFFGIVYLLPPEATWCHDSRTLANEPKVRSEDFQMAAIRESRIEPKG